MNHTLQCTGKGLTLTATSADGKQWSIVITNGQDSYSTQCSTMAVLSIAAEMAEEYHNTLAHDYECRKALLLAPNSLIPGLQDCPPVPVGYRPLQRGDKGPIFNRSDVSITAEIIDWPSDCVDLEANVVGQGVRYVDHTMCLVKL